jgi:cytochrome c
MRTLRAALLASVCLATPSHAEDQDQIERGRTLAEARCAPCHAVGPVGKSLNPNALPFRTLMQLYRVENMEQALEETIAAALKEPHSNPPFELSQAEIDDLIAYLASLEH